MLKKVVPKLLIDGKFVDAASGKTFASVDPRTGENIIQIAEGDAEDIDRQGNFWFLKKHFFSFPDI